MNDLVVIGIVIGAAAAGASVYLHSINKKKKAAGQTALSLRNISLFSKLPPESLAKLERVTQVLQVAPDQVVFNEDDPGDSLYIVARGQLNVTKKIDGKIQVLKVMQPGDILGEMGLLTGQPRTANAVAKTELSLFKIGRLAFDELTKDDQVIRDTIWMTYAWHVFDNYQSQQKIPKSMNRDARQRWFARHIPQSIGVGQKTKVVAGAAYAFILMGEVKVSSESYKSPSLVPVTNIIEITALKNVRLLWLPPEQ